VRATDEGELHCRLPIQACRAMHIDSIQAMMYIYQVDSESVYHKRHSCNYYEDDISDYVKFNNIGKVL